MAASVLCLYGTTFKYCSVLYMLRLSLVVVLLWLVRTTNDRPESGAVLVHIRPIDETGTRVGCGCGHFTSQ